MSRAGHGGETLLVSGFPKFHARKLLEHLLGAEPEASFVALVGETDAPLAAAFRERLAAPVRERLRFVTGTPTALDLGLSGASYLELARSVDRIYHFASEIDGGGADAAATANVAGARELLELARACSRLRGVIVLSSAFVSGTRDGVVREDELAAGQRFRRPLDESLATVERMLERHPEVPALIVRPTQIVGDSRTGEIDRAEWPYPLIAWVVNGPEEIALTLPRARSALQVVPIDFVVRATHYLAQSASSYGRRYHLCDEHPPTVEEFVVLLAERCDKRIAPGLNLLTRGFSAGGLRLISDGVRSLLDALGADARYDTSQAQAALAGAGIACPSLESYLPALIDYARRELFPAKDGGDGS